MKIQRFALTSLPLYFFSLISFGQSAPAAKKVHIATYNTFAEQKTKFGYHKTARKTYKIQRILPSGISYGEPQDLERASLARTSGSSSGPYYPNGQKCSGEIFAGTDRAMAKTHEATDGIDTSFNGFDEFYTSGLLKPDEEMIQYTPPITKKPESPRVSEEKYNVSVDTVYIYGIYREDDNDFHMIIGNGKTGSSMKLLNAEVSGLPEDTSDSLLIVVRNKIIARFGDIACKDGAYKPVNALIPIQIRGSIFFDIDHKAGIVGFGIYKPTTAWELHPVTGIKFLDE